MCTGTETIWQEFWKPICTKESGEVDLEQIKKELADFYFAMQEVPKVYCHITGNKLSKIMYRAETVIEAADRHYEGMYEEAE